MQRAKQTWLEVGDRNTKYFYKKATIRSQKNRIVALKDSSGVLATDPVVIEAMFLDHFRSIFRCEEGSSATRAGDSDVGSRFMEGVGEAPSLLATITTRLTDDQRRGLDQPITSDEVRAALFQMDGRKASGPDGFVASGRERKG